MSIILLQFILLGILPLSILTGYLLYLVGYQLNEIIVIVGIEFLIFIIFPLVRDNFKNKQSFVVMLTIAMIFAIGLVGYKKFYKDQEIFKDKKIEERIAGAEARFDSKIFDLKSQIESPTKNIYSESIPKPQNAEEAFKQHTEADYEFRNGNYEVARKIYKNILENYSVSNQLRSILQNSMGATYGNADDYNNALFWYNKAKEYKDHSLNVRENIARNYFKLGEYDKAINEYQKILRKNPTDYGIYNKIGIMYSLSGQHDKAIENFNTAIENGFIIQTLYFNLALNYIHKGSQFDNKAIEYLEKELELYPNNPVAMF
ncbi:MAG: tetratricopeptide repeat protein, partial [bacterium]|nr:tetratricopeptide repeat protein [bacterium]